ncbi:MAG: hypothetical protein WCA27_14275 [Candidatus Sulfotelmatobacter sp.]
MLLSSTQVIPRSQHEEESSLLRRKIEEEYSFLRRKIEELNRNTVLLIAEAGRLIHGSKQLSDRLKSFEDPSTKRKVTPITASGNR